MTGDRSHTGRSTRRNEMARASAAHQQGPAQSAARQARELEDLQLVIKARNGDGAALDALMRRYTGFVRLKASSYFLAGGDSDDLLQEGLIGLYKAVRDFRADKETSFRSFAELCVTRQIITAIKTATRFKHAPLNTYVSFSHTPAGQDSDSECTLGDALPGPGVNEPSVCVISTEELQSLVFTLGTGLSRLLGRDHRSEEHTSELQSLTNLVCRLLLEKKKQT